MRIFKKWDIKKVKTVDEAEKDEKRKFAVMVNTKDQQIRNITADRDAANKQIDRLCRNGTELAFLYAAVREAKQEKRIRVIFDRLMPKPKAKVKVPLKEQKS